MAAFLCEAWVAEVRDPLAVAAAHAGLATSIQHVVTGAPGGEVRYGTVVGADGSLTPVAGDVADAEVALTDTYANAVRLLRGELDPNAAFMSGTTKVAGHTGRLLDVLAAAQGDAYATAQAELLAATEV